MSRSLALGAAVGLVLGCGSSTPKANGVAGNQGSSGTTSSGGGADLSAGSGTTPGAGGPAAGAPGAGGPAAGAPGASGSTGAAGAPMLTSSAAAVAAKLGRPARFLIGMGNDLNDDHSMDGAYTLGTTLDLHYAYLVAYLNADKSWGSWKDWNAGGTFINVLADAADAKGVVPMYTMYAMAAAGDGILAGLTDDVFEKGYWGDIKLMFQRIAAFNKPAVVQFEPDFWAYAEIQSKEAPSSMKVNLTANAPDCAGLSNDLVGMGHCLVKLARMYAPKAIVGFHASQWSAGSPTATVAFLKACGADQADVIFADVLDRDAGCFEAKGDGCIRDGNFYWDETNKTSPNFHEYLSWSTAITGGLGRPMIWWQVPFGVPSATKGGTAGHYRDNRVHYIFSHIAEFVAAGGLGAVFGTGADGQTYITTDGDQFKNAVAAYYKKPVTLP